MHRHRAMRGLTLALLYKIVTGYVAINPDQIGLVAADNRTRANHKCKFRAKGASSTGLRYSFAVRIVSDWNQLPAVVVQQENPAAFKAQLTMCAPVCIPWPTTTTISVILHEEVCWLLCKKDKTRGAGIILAHIGCQYHLNNCEI